MRLSEAQGSRLSFVATAPGAAGGNAALPRAARHHQTPGATAGGTIPRPTGLFATSRHGNFTSSSKLPEPSHLVLSDFWSSSTKWSAAASRIAIDDSTRANLRITVRASQPPYSQLYAQFERAHHALRQPQPHFCNENRALTIDQHSQGRPHAAVAAANARRRRRGKLTASARPSSDVARENMARNRIPPRDAVAAAREGRDGCALLCGPRNRGETPPRRHTHICAVRGP